MTPEKMTIRDFVKMFDEIYSPTKNLEREFHQVLSLFVESIAKISQYITKEDHPNLMRFLPQVFAWYCSLIIKAGLSDISDVLWKKYPCVCPYCLNPECTCHIPGRKKPIQPETLAEFERNNIKHRPTTLDLWQDHFQKIYPRYPEYDYRRIFAHLIEEVGEVAEAYRIRYFYRDNLPHEAADVLTWIFGIVNLINARQPDERVSLAAITFQRYSNCCDKCQQTPCRCPPEPLMNISEPFPKVDGKVLVAIKEEIISTIEKSRPITIHVNESVIASLNLGTVVGNITTSLSSLDDAGLKDVTEAFRRVTEAVINASELGAQRQDIVEQLSELALQAQRPAEERRSGALKAIISTVGASLATSANLATVWGQWGNIIQKYFGF